MLVHNRIQQHFPSLLKAMEANASTIGRNDKDSSTSHVIAIFSAQYLIIVLCVSIIDHYCGLGVTKPSWFPIIMEYLRSYL